MSAEDEIDMDYCEFCGRLDIDPCSEYEDQDQSQQLFSCQNINAKRRAQISAAIASGTGA